MTLFSSLDKPDATLPDSTIPADSMAARLQARVEALEAQPEPLAPARRIPTHTGSPVPEGGRSAEVEDLHQQLEVLRDQLETAFDDVDERIAAADQRAAAAHVSAEAADARAQIASARAGNILYAVDDLAHELTRIAESNHPEVGRLLSAVERLRARLHPATAPSSAPAG